MLIFSPRNIASRRLGDASLPGQREEKTNGFVGNSVPRVIEIEAGAGVFDDEQFAASGIIGKQTLELNSLDLLVVRLQRPPSRDSMCR